MPVSKAYQLESTPSHPAWNQLHTPPRYDCYEFRFCLPNLLFLKLLQVGHVHQMRASGILLQISALPTRQHRYEML